MKIEIDNESGFCYGVIRAIEQAENNLKELPQLYSLGAIVHNNSELERLNNIGLKVIDYNKLEQLSDTTVLIRAHGEPPTTYKIAERQNIKLIDCTCPVVLKLQERIRDKYNKGQIVIFGKKGHAEVNGLIGQVDNNATIVDICREKAESNKVTNGETRIGEERESTKEERNETKKYIGLENIDFTQPIHIFSQTTKDPKEYDEICNVIKERVTLAGGSLSHVTIHNTICKQVARRHINLVKFAEEHSVIIFVSGKESSNGKVLYDLCNSVNKRSYHIQQVEQIKDEWLKDNDSVGICGATSTPKWQLEEVANYLARC